MLVHSQVENALAERRVAHGGRQSFETKSSIFEALGTQAAQVDLLLDFAPWTCDRVFVLVAAEV